MRYLMLIVLLSFSLGGCAVTQGSSNCKVTASGVSAGLGPRLADVCDFILDKVTLAPQALEVPGVFTYHQAPVCKDRSQEYSKIIQHDLYGEHEDSRYIDPDSRYFYTREKVAGNDCYNPIRVQEETYQRFRTQQ